MENNSNAIAEIQKKYAGCNLLMPAATEVQLNPFYKITVMEVTADLSENSGDIFKVGSVKTGTTQQGNDIWEETYSPAKPLLMKIAAAAGIQFDPDHTYGTKIDANTYKAKAYGAMRMPDGTGKTHADDEEQQDELNRTVRLSHWTGDRKAGWEIRTDTNPDIYSLRHMNKFDFRDELQLEVKRILEMSR